MGTDGEDPQALDGAGAEGARLADALGAGVGLVDLGSGGEVARQEAEADGDAIGMQTVADQVVKIGPVEEPLDGLLGTPAPPVGGEQRARPPGARAGDAAPGAAPVAGGAGARGDEAQPLVPGAGAQAGGAGDSPAGWNSPGLADSSRLG